MRSFIRGLSYYVPEEVLTNQYFESYLDTSDEWITQRTGIKERRRAASEENTSDMGKIAAERAIESAGISKDDIDLIICATATADMPFPSAACLIGAKLGLPGVPAFDLAAGCTGFVYALSVADAFIRSGSYRNILVIGAERLTRIIDPLDRATVVLFGDGAGAAVVSASEDENKGILGFKLHADGTYGDLLYMPARGTAVELTEEVIKQRLHYTKMKGNELFKIAVREMGNVAVKLLEELGIDRREVDWLIPHQANIRIISALAKRLGLYMDKVIVNLQKYGNTSAASIPIALGEAIEEGKIKKGDLLLLVAFGAGLTWGAIAIRW
ncbi:3-oxoacyl-[acyl-carrier-protein] synthase III [Thermosulfidibacter takaii ABI70S6]|uniref:Beta-ketoacyl-[acyl-carrier-protein] synthase III n=1 Tax=Thermosulfidibacter takaii (strain DSM 17441 / JCM 13301 / NBRC 103674 / ABI70S6) TaxID=1298851 RepID=A0A0S3QUV7_THET7|nr:beta-ketoacyl-ACP synthase III [Thermosulfidibacter takaii]BAT72117.1 3-oxoacyl-[acyl-carrier-protein] synthase III [Thermosulfidibacter takaii ABI70S6]